MNKYVKIAVYSKEIRTTYYSTQIYVEDKLVTDQFETDEFFRRIISKGYPNEASIIRNLIKSYGLFGLDRKIPRFEDNAGAFLPKNKYLRDLFPEMPLDNLARARLYLYHLNEFEIILMNGDIKTTDRSVRECPNCSPHFFRAKRVSTFIDKLISEKQIDPTNFIDCINELEIPL